MKQFRIPSLFPRVVGVVAATMAAGLVSELVFAEDYTAGFDGERTSWQVSFDKSRSRILQHHRQQLDFVQGTGSERVTVKIFGPETWGRIEHALPEARVLDDLKLSLWMKSNRSGTVASLRVVFPYQVDPRTGDVLQTEILGDTYQQVGEWQELRCTTLERQIREQLRWLRQRIRKPLNDLRGAYVDRVILTTNPDPPGQVEYVLDHLQFGPIVPPREAVDGAREYRTEDRQDFPVEFRLARLLVEDRPFLPLFAPYHGEDPTLLRQAGLNTLWVPDMTDRQLLGNLRKHGLWAAATPPRPRNQTGRILDARTASSAPFAEETAEILFWIMGTRISENERSKLLDRIEQTRNADRRYRRPIMSDVQGLEWEMSRHVQILGLSRAILNTNFSLRDYRDWLVQRRQLARPGTFATTWIQTEPAFGNSTRKRMPGALPVVTEPEQIHLQVFAALAAGVRALGYWNTTALDSDGPGAMERRLVIEQINLELELLEPWLATSTSTAQVAVTVGRDQQPIEEPNRSQRNSLFRTRRQKRERTRQQPHHSEIEATVLRTDFGILVLPIWYGKDAQFVPGPMTARDVSIVVPGVDRSARAYQVSTTDIRNLNPLQPAVGGVRITLPIFDMTAAIVLTSDETLVQAISQKMKTLQQRSARVSTDLARAKLGRVREVDRLLQERGAGLSSATDLMTQAGFIFQRAEALFRDDDFHGARLASSETLQLLRDVQQRHWRNAVTRLSSPTSSPYTVCFQTLPDHWRMISQIGRSSASLDGNLLRSGDFEDIDTMVAEGWKHEQTPQDEVRATAELYPVSEWGRYCLRLVSVPAVGEEISTAVRHSPVRVTTPTMTVHSGQIVHVSGRVRLPTAITANLDGAMLYDSLTGPTGALHWRKQSGWQRFELIREARYSGPFSLTIVMNGLGEIQFDEVKVVLHTPRHDAGIAESPGNLPTNEKSRSGALDFLNRWSTLNPLRSKPE